MEASISERPKYNRIIPVIASVAIQFCIGAAYIWSVFQSYLIITKATPDALFNWPPTYGTLAYSLVLGCLGIGGMLGGKIQRRYSMRVVVITSGVLTGLGFFLAQFTAESTPWFLWLTYGIMGGLGMGISYTNTISCCQKWFPDKKGLIGGIVVSALGFGGFAFTPLTEYLISIYGVLHTFGILGIIILIIGLTGSFFIKNPPEGFMPQGWTPPAPKPGQIIKDFSVKEALHTPQFYMVALAFMCATSSGAMMTPMAKILGLQTGSGLTREAAISGVMIISIFNAFGRIFWGGLSDKFGRKITLTLLSCITIASIIGVGFAHSYAILILIGLIGFSFGGFLGVFPALAADFWGSKNFGTIYGMVLIGFGIGVIISSFTVASLSARNAFTTAFIIAAIAAATGLVIISFTKQPTIKEKNSEAA